MQEDVLLKEPRLSCEQALSGVVECLYAPANAGAVADTVRWLIFSAEGAVWRREGRAGPANCVSAVTITRKTPNRGFGSMVSSIIVMPWAVKRSVLSGFMRCRRSIFYTANMNVNSINPCQVLRIG
jgi:hypothetical protein